MLQLSQHPRITLAAALLLVGAAPRARAQGGDDKLSVHGSLNAGYARANGQPALGIPTRGTEDYRIMTLQVRYAFSPKDQFVTQLLNRRIGSSPLRNAIGDVSAQWAFWQHSEGNFTVKAGRAPFPRGLLNEVRYIGTVLPFFRVSAEYTGDAFDAIDGVVASYRQPLGRGWSLEGHAMGGGTENRSVRATASELTVRISRAHNLLGGQLYVDGPQGIRLGLHGSRYDRRQENPTLNGFRSFVGYSGQIDQPRWLARAEHIREAGHDPSSDIKTTYGQVIGRVHSRVHLAGEVTSQQQRIFNADPRLNVDVNSVQSSGVAANFFVTSQAVLKFERHWRNGYTYDAFTPPTRQVGSQIFVNPKAKAGYWIASAAVSF